MVPVVRTFLIADVRGYTRFTQEHGDEAAAALASSFADIVERVVSEYDGDLIELRGDEALVVFASARQALRAAVAVQRSCREQRDGGPALPLGVGIGLDAGEAVPLAGGGYRGGALNLAARLCSIAAPGQVLASEGVVHLARKVDGLQYRPRRAERLKGIADRVKVNEVVPDQPLPPVPTAALPPRRKAHTRWLVSGALGVAALVAGLLAVFLTGRGSADSTIAANAAGLIEPNGNVAAQVPISGRPAGVAMGVGALWVTDSVNATLLRIDPNRQVVIDRIAVGSDPGGVAVGPDSVWVANSQDGSVSRIDPANDKVVATIPVGNGPTSVAYGARSIWVLNTIDATISRLDSGTGRTTATIPLGQNPTRLAFGLGQVWVTSGEAGVLLRIDPATNSVVQAVSVGNGPVGIALGDSAVWVASTPDRTISRVEPSSGAVTKISLQDRPAEVAYTDGLVWVANTLDGTVTQIEADSQHVKKTIRTVDNPAALAPAGRQVWTIALTSSLAHRGGTLRIAAGKNDSAFDTPDPGAAYRPGSWQMASIVYDGLVTYKRTGGPSGNTVVPDLAAAMPVIQDGGTTYVFKLRKGIRYSNGTPVRPSDLRPSIERQYRAHTGLDLLGLRGSDRCTARACDLSKAIVSDDSSSTITFHLTEPDSDFLFRLALTFGSFIPPGSPQIPKTKAPLPGSGPYMIKRFVPNRTLILVRNPYFHEWSAEAQPAGYPDRIEYTFGLEPSAAASAVETGKADFALETPPAHRLPEIATRFSSLAHPHVEASTFFFGLNTRIPPFNDVRIRRALNFAVDRGKLRRLWGGPQLMRTTCQVLPPGIAGYRPYCPYSADAGSAGLWTAPDIGQARRLIAAAGGARGTVTVAADRDAGVKEAAARYVAQLLKQLGYRARVHLYPGIFELYQAVGSAHTRTQISISGWRSDFPRASDFFMTLLACASYQPGAQINLNSTGFCDPQLDREMQRAQQLAATDVAASSGLWSRVDHKVVDAAPWVAVLNAAGLELTSKRVANYQRNPQFGVLIDQLWVR
jgi:YVTN family beta-propeller protein